MTLSTKAYLYYVTAVSRDVWEPPARCYNRGSHTLQRTVQPVSAAPKNQQQASNCIKLFSLLNSQLLLNFWWEYFAQVNNKLNNQICQT